MPANTQLHRQEWGAQGPQRGRPPGAGLAAVLGEGNLETPSAGYSPLSG